jgi:hypothetical protein
LRWSSSKVPTIDNIEILADCPLFARGLGAALLSNAAGRTAFEQPGATWAATIDQLHAGLPRPTPLPSVRSMAAVFAAHVMPMAREPSTRDGHWRNWRAVVTWAIAHGALQRILPIRLDVLQALSWQLLALRCGPAHLQSVWGAIAQRHRDAGLATPLDKPGEYSRWLHACSVTEGRPRLLKFPIQREVIAKLLSRPGIRRAPYAEQRNTLATVLATICCTRCSEVAALQACDLLFDFDTLRGAGQYHGTMAIKICKRKNDAIRKGLFPRIGRPKEPGSTNDVVAWLRTYLAHFGLNRHGACTRSFRDRERCPVCPPVFCMTAREGRVTVIRKTACSRQLISDAITQTVATVGVDADMFSGISARKGGLSTAIEAGVPEWVLFFQSGHGQSKAARAYMALDSPTFLFDTWKAFLL